MKNFKTCSHCLIVALAILTGVHHAAAQGTAFTYQGQLQNDGSPAGGTYNLNFSLYNMGSGGSPVAPPVTTNGVIVTNGLFTVTIDFGPNVFTGGTNWLQIGVETNGGSSFTTLTTRQQLTPTPYAIFATTSSNVTGTIPAAQISGPLPSSGFSGTYSNAVTLNNANNSFNGTFTGNGSGLTNLAAWQLTGNTGTTSSNFLGTTDNQSLQIRVAGAQAGLFTPSNGSPNIIFGPAQNVISNGTAAASILGGSNNAIGATSSFSLIGGGSQNLISSTADHSAVVGGSGNSILAGDDHSFIGGGVNNNIQAGADLSVLGGGQGNTIGASAYYSFVGGGVGNTVFGNASYAVIGGGNANIIGASAYQSVIAGGNSGNIQSDHSFIGSGIDNAIQASAGFSVLAGGQQNLVWTGSYYSFLGGGLQNSIFNNASNSFLGSGANNNLQAGYSVIGGGQQNVISNTSDHSVLVGGDQNTIQGSASLSYLGGGQFNSIQAGANQSVLGGGYQNTIRSNATTSVITGGYANSIQTGSVYSFIGGGYNNQIQANSVQSVLGGGYINSISASDSVLVGGEGNSIQNGASVSVIVGGDNNFIQSNTPTSFIGGGAGNIIAMTTTSGGNAFIGGGFNNLISTNCGNSVVVGGAGNQIQATGIAPSVSATIVGGQNNIISPAAYYSFIGGGYQNKIGNGGTNANYATVPGGLNNYAGGAYSFAAGQRAKANFQGDFVWADSQAADFNSSSNDQFLVRAKGGVQFATSGAGLTVDGQPVQAGNNGAGLTNLNASSFTSGTLPAAQLPGSVLTNNEPLSILGTLFLTGNLLLPPQATITAGLTPILVADTNDNSYFGLDAGFDNKGSSGNNNTGIGFQALQQNTTGSDNVAIGAFALGNAHDFGLVAVGYGALQNDAVTGSFIGGANTAVGYQSLQADTSGSGNTGMGFQSLGQTTGGANNTAIGFFSLLQNTGGNNNTALGSSALVDATGNNNIGIGNNGGENLTSGNNNIDIGNAGNSGESGIIRIGTEGTQTQAFIPGLLNCDALSTGLIITPGPITCGPINASGIVSAPSFLTGGALVAGGSVTCCSITIAGGCDLAEPFQIAGHEQDVPEGAVVVIDEANPGHLKLSDEPYDTRVAGVVSGANGIHPGIQMQQQGLLEGGRNVALTGRVYVQADASNGAIKPGDLLTTSSTPGRAMRVSDHLKAQGAILGKAMTGLKDGQGMVLVLVTLQ